ncbi:hypothetical protein M3Y94_00616700 [Aphelenchoides besseyi]|nr:hypothetical protein M3Y94_00616700 [Aphelenchoides besseyi]
MVFKHVPIRERDAPYYHCLCGVHVHRGAFIIAIIGLIFSLVAVLNGFLLAQWLTLPLPIISVLLYIGVIIGNKKRVAKPLLALHHHQHHRYSVHSRRFGLCHFDWSIGHFARRDDYR